MRPSVRRLFRIIPLCLIVAPAAAPRAHALLIFGNYSGPPIAVGSVTGPWHIEIFTAAGYSKPDLAPPGATPTLGHYGFGATLARRFGPVLVGVTSDARFVSQYSDVDARVGNMRGYRVNYASPTLGVAFGRVLLKGDYQLLGAHNLFSLTAGGNDVAFAEPRGWRAIALYRLRPSGRLLLGPFYEKITFGKEEQTSSVGSGKARTRPLSRDLQLWQVGLALSVVF